MKLKPNYPLSHHVMAILVESKIHMEYRFFTALLGSFRLHKADKSSENESHLFACLSIT